MANTKFTNLPTKKLYLFLAKLVGDKKISHQDIADAFEVYQANASGYLYALRTGAISIKLEHVLKAQKHFGLNPCDLFNEDDTGKAYGIAEDELQTVNEPHKTITPSFFKDLIISQQGVISSQQRTIESLVLKKSA